ncbi:hypothetical protein SH139x_000446 [Planctomycetaceae bacterium SH139]
MNSTPLPIASNQPEQLADWPEQRVNWIAQLAVLIWQPCLVFLPFLLLGLVLWLAPTMEGAAGFRIREELSFANFFILIAWYGCIVVCAALGQLVARSFPPQPFLAAGAINTEGFYRALSGLALIGVGGAWLAALSNGTSLVELIKTQQFNLLKDSLYENYNHLYSLRYTASLVGGYAMYRLVFLGRFSWLDALNFCLLLAAAAISARLLIAQAVIFAGGLAIRFDAIQQVKGRTILLTTLGLSVCIVTFTWARSAGSYRDFFGVSNPVAMTYLECQRYLAAPIQASMGVARIAAYQPHRGSPSNVIKYVTPTFLHPEEEKAGDNSGGVGEQWYLDEVDVDETLTTNSAFVDMYGDLGLWAFPVIAWVSFLAAGVGTYFWRADNLLCLIGCVVLYGFFELWRTYYFAAGSFTFLILAIIAAGCGSRFLTGRFRVSLFKPQVNVQ